MGQRGLPAPPRGADGLDPWLGLGVRLRFLSSAFDDRGSPSQIADNRSLTFTFLLSEHKKALSKCPVQAFTRQENAEPSTSASSWAWEQSSYLFPCMGLRAAAQHMP